MPEPALNPGSGARLYVIVPVFDGLEQIRQCLDLLRQCERYAEIAVVVVDHGPTDTVSRALETSHPEVICRRGNPELWWAGATNLGIRWALGRGAELIMLLNHDCRLSADSVVRLLKHTESSELAIYAPVQYNADSGSVYCHTAKACFLLALPTVIGRRRVEPKTDNGLHSTPLILGGRGVVIPRAVFDRAGFFDEENLPHYWSDHDFYVRARKSGIALYVAQDAAVWIDHATTTIAKNPGQLSWTQFIETLVSRRSHRNLRDIAALLKKHYPVPGMHYLGVALHLVRYTLVYVCKRLLYLAGVRV